MVQKQGEKPMTGKRGLYHFARIWIGLVVGLGTVTVIRVSASGRLDGEMFLAAVLVIGTLLIPGLIAYGAFRRLN